MIVFGWAMAICLALVCATSVYLWRTRRFKADRQRWRKVSVITGLSGTVMAVVLVANSVTPSPETGMAVAAATVSSSKSSTSTATSTATPTSGTGTPLAGACPAEYVQNFDPNEGYKFYSAGVQTSADDLVYLGHDARTLAFRAFTLKLVASPDPSVLLTPDGTCLSQEGQNAYLMTKGALTASGTTVDENGQAPEDGINTGMEGGKAVVSSAPGIYGDRAAIIYTLGDGTKVIVLKRCGNLVFQGRPPEGIPIGNTDNPPPPPTMETPPPAETTPVTEYTPPTTAYTPPSTVVTTTPNEAKVASQGAAAQGNVPQQVTGYNPPPARDPSPPSVDSPAPQYTYVAPAPPAAAPSEAPTTVARSTPPAAPVTGAPAASDPATACAPPPGKTTC